MVDLDSYELYKFYKKEYKHVGGSDNFYKYKEYKYQTYFGGSPYLKKINPPKNSRGKLIYTQEFEEVNKLRVLACARIQNLLDLWEQVDYFGFTPHAKRKYERHLSDHLDAEQAKRDARDYQTKWVRHSSLLLRNEESSAFSAVRKWHDKMKTVLPTGPLDDPANGRTDKRKLEAFFSNLKKEIVKLYTTSDSDTDTDTASVLKYEFDASAWRKKEADVAKRLMNANRIRPSTPEEKAAKKSKVDELMAEKTQIKKEANEARKAEREHKKEIREVKQKAKDAEKNIIAFEKVIGDVINYSYNDEEKAAARKLFQNPSEELKQLMASDKRDSCAFAEAFGVQYRPGHHDGGRVEHPFICDYLKYGGPVKCVKPKDKENKEYEKRFGICTKQRPPTEAEIASAKKEAESNKEASAKKSKKKGSAKKPMKIPWAKAPMKKGAAKKPMKKPKKPLPGFSM